jgi:hypothetical protein
MWIKWDKMGVYVTCIEWDRNGRVQERKNVEMKPRTSRNASGLECVDFHAFSALWKPLKAVAW